jgi:hypothetical protein
MKWDGMEEYTHVRVLKDGFICLVAHARLDRMFLIDRTEGSE